jgi:carboxypeptidase Q
MPESRCAVGHKILLVVPKDPKHADLFKGMSKFPILMSAAAERHVLAIVAADWRPGIVLPHTGPVGFAGSASDIPVVSLANEQEQLISNIIDSGHPVRIKLDIQNTFSAGPVPSHNIVGEIRGSQNPEQIVIVSAHLDSWDLATGAIDDGFGVAAVLGAAHSIISSGVKPKRTIRFVLFTGEEQGLLGSKAYLQAHPGELHNVICAFALDWGNGPITKIPLAGHEELRTPLEDLFRSMADLASIKVVSGFLMSTDAYAFTLAGIPGIAPFQDSPNYSMIGHSAADTLDKVNPQVLTRDSATLALLALWLADHPHRLGSIWPAEEIDRKLSENGLTR